jgi:hypothetical protein
LVGLPRRSKAYPVPSVESPLLGEPNRAESTTEVVKRGKRRFNYQTVPAKNHSSTVFVVF